MGQVNVIFHGVCSHFIDVLPDVPHRVVLPDCSSLRLGIVQVGDAEGTYFLMPHFPVLRSSHLHVQESLTISQLMVNGNILDSVHLQIANPSKVENHYEDSFQSKVPRLTHYVENYVVSEEVISGGRAAVYFDVLGAVWEKVRPDSDEAVDVVARIETAGAPELLVTSFQGGAEHRIRLGDDSAVDFWVANQGMDCDAPDNLDFILHYVTARGGIPRRLKHATPGMGTPPEGFVPWPTWDAGIDKLKTLDYPNRFDAFCFELDTIRDSHITSIACANSQYP